MPTASPLKEVNPGPDVVTDEQIGGKNHRILASLNDPLNLHSQILSNPSATPSPVRAITKLG